MPEKKGKKGSTKRKKVSVESSDYTDLLDEPKVDEAPKTEKAPKVEEAKRVELAPTKPVRRKKAKAIRDFSCRYGALRIAMAKGQTKDFSEEVADWLIRTNRCVG